MLSEELWHFSFFIFGVCGKRWLLISAHGAGGCWVTAAAGAAIRLAGKTEEEQQG